MLGFFGWVLPSFVPEKIGGSARFLNNLQCADIFNRFTQIALSRFKWTGLPESCNENALETTLFFYGKAVFFFDEDYGYIHTPVQLPGPFNIYYESVVREAYSFGPFHRKLTMDDSVLIKSNRTMYPEYQIVWNYAPKIANVIRAIDVHTETLKRPFMIKCQEKEVTSVKRAISKINDNELAVVGDKFADPDSFKVFQIAKECYLAEFWANVKNYSNQVLSSLGVKNNFSTKKERQITSEVQGEENSVRHTLESDLAMRELAAKEINARYGLNVKVEANELEEFTDEMIEVMAAKVAGITGGEQNDTDMESK